MNLSNFIFSNNRSINICYYLILFFPIALIVGPLIAEFFLFLLIVLAFTVSDFRNNFFKIIRKNLIIKLFCFFWLYIFFLSMLNYDNLDILKTGLFYFRYILFSLVIFYLISKNQKILNFFFILYLILITIILIDSFIQHHFGQNILGYEKFGSRIVSFFEGEGILGSFIVRFYVLASAFYFLSKFIINKSLILLILLLITILLIFTLERSALILFLISNILLFFSINQNKQGSLIKFLLTLLIVILSFYIIAKQNSMFVERF